MKKPSGGTPIRAELPKWCHALLNTSQRTMIAPELQWVLLVRKSNLTPTARMVAFNLYFYAAGSEEGTAWPSLEQMSEDIGKAERTISDALSELASHGWLFKSRRRDRRTGNITSNKYTLCFPKAREV